MTIQVTGNLVGPVGDALVGAVIRIVTLENASTLPYTESRITTGSGGSYNFNLLNGKYSIEILQTDTFNKVAYIEVTDVTVTPIDIESLLEGYSFCNVEAPSCAV